MFAQLFPAPVVIRIAIVHATPKRPPFPRRANVSFLKRACPLIDDSPRGNPLFEQQFCFGTRDIESMPVLLKPATTPAQVTNGAGSSDVACQRLVNCK